MVSSKAHQLHECPGMWDCIHLKMRISSFQKERTLAHLETRDKIWPEMEPKVKKKSNKKCNFLK